MKNNSAERANGARGKWLLAADQKALDAHCPGRAGAVQTVAWRGGLAGWGPGVGCRGPGVAGHTVAR